MTEGVVGEHTMDVRMQKLLEKEKKNDGVSGAGVCARGHIRLSNSPNRDWGAEGALYSGSEDCP